MSYGAQELNLKLGKFFGRKKERKRERKKERKRERKKERKRERKKERKKDGMDYNSESLRVLLASHGAVF